MTNKNYIKNCTILLVKKASGEHYSVEAGLHDGVKNFDHHPGSWEHIFQTQPPSPANNDGMNVEIKNEVIEITHLDADTLLGIARLIGNHPNQRYNQFWGIYEGILFDHKMEWVFDLDPEVIEKIDLNGSKGIEKFDKNLLYMVGVGQFCRDFKFPRLSPGTESLDVSDILSTIFEDWGCEEFIELGRETQKKAEKAYTECKVAGTLNNSTQGEAFKGLWVVSDNSFDPSRPYEDGVQIVVVYRSHYKSISIYCDPDSIYEFGGKTVGGVLFAGHAKACGSPRGEEMTLEDARRVFESI